MNWFAGCNWRSQRKDNRRQKREIHIAHRPLIAAVTLLAGAFVHADGSGNPAAVKSQDGEYFDKAGNPTFKIAKDGAVDWYTYSGYVRYGANCKQCHGPDGLGSSYAPSLVDSLKSLSYAEFLAIVASGKQDVNAAQQLVMPSFGTNRNVMCYIDPIYVYLRARSDGALGRELPEKHAPKPEAFKRAEDSCMSG
jgi:methanol metabolism-related c-type cytochrome